MISSQAKTTDQDYLDDYYGLYSLDTRKPIPLKELAVQVFINENIANVRYSQKFYNDSDSMLEAEYLFTITSTACYDGFKARMNNCVIEGVIKEKKLAAKEYKEFTESGTTVAYAQLNKSVQSVLMVKIGNIPPYTEIDIEFSYIEMLQVCMNKFWKFVLPNSLMPKPPPKVKYLTRKLTYGVQGEDKYPFKLDITVCGNDKEITFIKCPSHDNADILRIEDDTMATIEVVGPNLYNHKDFVLIYSINKITKPRLVLSKFEEGYCGMITHFPELNVLSLQNAYNAYLEGRDPGQGLDMSLEIGEFVFLLDASSDMSGKRMKKAKEAVIYFLKSLPEDSYFNIIAFNEGLQTLCFDGSVASTEENVESAITFVEDVEVKPESCKMLAPLEFVFKRPHFKGYPRNIFLLMGSKPNMEEIVLNYIAKHRDQGRIFTLGIGNVAPKRFLKEAAKLGRGKFESVGDEEDIIDGVVYLLKTAIMPNIIDINVDLDDTNKSLVSYITPDPVSVEYLLPNQLMNFFVIFNKKLEAKKKATIKFSYFNSMKGMKEEFELEADVSKVDEDPSLVKLGMYQFAKSLLNQHDVYTAQDDADIEQAIRDDVKQSLIKISEKYGILTRKTAFNCVIKEGDDTAKQIPTRKVTIKCNKATPQGAKFNRFETDDFEIDNYQETVRGPPMKILGYLSTVDDDEETQSPETRQASFLSDTLLRSFRNMTVIESPRNFTTLMPFKPKTSLLLDIIRKQKVSGYWQPTPDLVDAAQLDLIYLNANVPKNLLVFVEKDLVWWTMIILVWIKYHFSELEPLWKCISQKANSWLKKKNVEFSEYESRIVTLLRRHHEDVDT